MRSAVRESRPRPGDRHRYWYLDGPPVVLPLSALEPDGFAAWSRTADLPPGVRVTYHGNAVRVAFGDAGTVTVPVSAGTLGGFVAWAWSDDFPPSGRISFVDQEVFLDMSPEEIQTHNQVKAAVMLTLGKLVEEEDLGQLYPDRGLFRNQAARLSTEPDGSFATWQTLESGRVYFTSMAGEEGGSMVLEGTPDWVMEVASDSSAATDAGPKRLRYFRAGIPEYWMIDARGEELLFTILVRRNRYVPVRPRDNWYPSPVFGRDFRLVQRRNRIGGWSYTLEVRPASA